MPVVKKGETRNHYVKRAGHEMVHREGLTPEQAVGKAEGMYDEKWGQKGGKKSKYKRHDIPWT